MTQFPSAIEHTIVVLAALLNILLLFLIAKFSSKELGLYYLLSTIALCDIIMSLAHGITAPRAFLIGHTFAVTPHALFVEPSRVFSYLTTLISCTINTLLIYNLIVTRIRHVGHYRWLLASFAAVDICISLMHSITYPVGYLMEFGFIVVPLRFLRMPTSIGFWTMVVWLFMFFQTFVLLAFHYIYRFVLLCSPSWLDWTQRRNSFRFWVSIALVVDVLSAGSVAIATMLCFRPRDEYRLAFGPAITTSFGADLNAANKPGFLVMAFWLPGMNDDDKVWQAHTIGGMAFVGGQLIISAAIIAYCITRIVWASRNDRNSECGNRLMRRQLFRALVWQTIIPTFTTYTPVALVIISPLVLGTLLRGQFMQRMTKQKDVALGELGTLAIASAQLLPLIDPILIFYFVPRYRVTLPRFTRALFPTFS